MELTVVAFAFCSIRTCFISHHRGTIYLTGRLGGRIGWCGHQFALQVRDELKIWPGPLAGRGVPVCDLLRELSTLPETSLSVCRRASPHPLMQLVGEWLVNEEGKVKGTSRFFSLAVAAAAWIAVCVCKRINLSVNFWMK